ncbi:Cytoplasmic tRNA 2-thiolation protein 2 [Mycena sanguinolenta]|uniref:Cytoplasmic tRNA 2-thiolation protein 2 n=1 Tax=Mycena sanguinolenta TaxID=230812 RepID=A0A8H6ZCA6_9AGAR|nr:Cytoplasmic tRNA 2-thiolation protein 2 [Mycena sanguinolenta]
MSCGDPASEQDALMPRRTKFDKTRICGKCRTSAGNVVIRHAVYCKECFFPNVTTKFKRILEPTINANGTRKKGFKPAGNLCVGFSGGLGSTVLLDLISDCYYSIPKGEDALKGGKDHPRNAGVWKKATVCYVEICNALPGTRDRTEEVRAVVEQYPHFTFLPLRLEDAFDDAWWKKVGGQRSESHLSVDLANGELVTSSQLTPSRDPAASLLAYLSALPTQTAVPTAIQNLIRLLLLRTAWSTESSHLLLGTSLTSLSEEWQPAVEIGAKRMVKVNRPLRDVGIKECAVWAWWRGLKVVGKESALTGKQGIGALTKNFIVGLERDYPSTVSTIARTCGKLAPKDNSDVICMTLRTPGVQDWKARISIRSYADPTLTSPPPHAQRIEPDKPDGSSSSSLTPHLCYACHTTLTSRSSRGSTASSSNINSTPLPVWVAPQLSGGAPQEEWRDRKMEEAEMKQSIAEFFITRRRPLRIHVHALEL